MIDRIRALHVSQIFGVCALIYVAIVATGVIQAGFNLDDWIHLEGVQPAWAETEGRWGLEIIYRYVLGERPLISLQLLLAFGCFLGTSHLLAISAAPRHDWPIAFLLIFTLGVNHVYLVDMLHFNSYVFASPFALLLSVGAFRLVSILNTDSSTWFHVCVCVVAAQCLALSLATYQPYALAGLIVPLLVVLGRARDSSPRLLRWWTLRVMVVGVLGFILYKSEESVFLHLSDRAMSFARFGLPAVETFRLKLSLLPRMLTRLHLIRSIELFPTAFAYFMGLFSAAIMVLAAIAAVGEFKSGREQTDRALRATCLLLGVSGGMFVLPAIVWFSYSGLLVPARSIGYFGFVLASLTLAVLSVPSLPLFCRRAGLAMLAVTSIAMSVAASTVWADQATAASRDHELARAIYARVISLPGYDGTPFYVVGRRVYEDLDRGPSNSIGSSIFRFNNPNLGIFKHLYNLEWKPISAPFSPKRCSAFPAHGAAFIHEGRAFVCLNSYEDFEPPTRCVKVSSPHDVRVCMDSQFLMWIEPDCTRFEAKSRVLRSIVRLNSHEKSTEFHFDRAFEKVPHVELGGSCYRVVRASTLQGDQIEVGELGSDGIPVWMESFAAR